MFDSTLNPLSLPPQSEGQPPDQRPLPEIVASGKPEEADNPGWDAFALAYHDVEGKRYYAVQDWIIGVAQPADPRGFWAQMKRRFKKAGIELFTWCKQLLYIANNGKKYKMDHATAEGLYLITQRMDAETGLRDRILRFLAQAGVLVDDARTDPDGLMEKVIQANPERAIEIAIEAYRHMGKPDAWIHIRYEGIGVRKFFTAAVHHGMGRLPSPEQFGRITNTLRLGLWKRDTDTLRAQMKLRKNASLRDNMSQIALTYEMLAESVSAHILNQHTNLAFEQADQIVRTHAQLIGKQADEMGRTLNLDIATNQPLIAKKTAE